MFRKLFKIPKKYPPFEHMKAYANKDRYFRRCASWSGKPGEMIMVMDNHNPRVITMDPWPQMIFLGADGNHTVSEFTYFMADKYSGKIPSHLDVTVIEELQKLLDLKIIELTDGPARPEEIHDKSSDFSKK